MVLLLQGSRTWVLQQAQQLDLTQDACSIRDMLKHVVDLLDRHLLARVVVHRGAHHAIAALANDLLDGVPVGLPNVCEELLYVLVLTLHVAFAVHLLHVRSV
jgi:hypothetical protein